MNILVVDSEGILSEKQKRHAQNRLYYSLLRFEHRINRATMHLAFDAASEQVKCAVNVNVEGSGIISTKRANVSSQAVANLAISAIERKVAWRVDWQAWFNADTFATWLCSVGQPWIQWLGLSKGLVTGKRPVLEPPHRSEDFYRHQYLSGC